MVKPAENRRAASNPRLRRNISDSSSRQTAEHSAPYGAKRKVAIFDVDGTIVRSSLFIELVEEMVREGLFPEKTRAAYEKKYRAWLDRKGSYEAYLEAMVGAFMKNLKGVPFREFQRIGEGVAKAQKNRVYRYTRDLIKTLKRRGYFLLAVSQSPKGVLDVFCKGIGFDKIYGRFYEIGPQDRLTGEVAHLHLIANKGNIVRRAVEKEGLTLEDSYGVGDTEGDIPVLELVEHPICFNPNETLYRYAKLNAWKVVVERKDVIYEIR